MYTTDPIIEVFAICYNEEKILPFFLRHYSTFCHRITIYDNYSTDKTEEIINAFAKHHDVNIIKYDTKDSLDDSVYLNIKNNCWRTSQADYVIVVDCDEFLYHSDIKSFLRDTKQPVYKPTGFNMVSIDFPPDHCQLTNIVTDGVLSHNFSKMCLFSPAKLDSINYNLGCHDANPKDKNGMDIIPHSSSDLKLLHYKNLSFDHRYSKNTENSKRMSSFNSQIGAGIHYTYSKEQQYNEFLDIFNKREKVI